MTHLDPTNPFAQRSTLPYELTPFTEVRTEHYLPAIEFGISERLAAFEALATNPEPATEQNVIHAWESAGRTLGRALTAFYHLQSADTTDELDDLEAVISPQLARLSDAIYQNRALFDRLTELAGRRDAGEVVLDEQSSYWLETHLRDFERAGVNLPEDAQERLRALNTRIAELQSSFGRIALAGSNAAGVQVTDESELAGWSEAAKDGARAAAAASGREGWLIELDSCTPQRSLPDSDDRGLRQRIHTAVVTRGLGPEHDTRQLVVELARARAERAALLGFPHHAEYVASDACSRSTAEVSAMLGKLAPAAVRNAEGEADELRGVLAGIDADATLEPWDWQYLAERVRAERFSLDANLLRPYLELERVLHEGVFAAATGLFGITFEPRPDLAGYNDEVRVWEVKDADGTGIGLYLGDYFTRPGKQGGAWMDALVDQNDLLGQRPVVSNNLNLIKPPGGQPALLVWDEVITLFHEFGHALHGLLSATRYPSQSGTATPRDFVEFPSQVNEMWALDAELLSRYAVHHQTGEPIPASWIDTMQNSQQFNQGYRTTEFLAAAILDQIWHTTPLADLPTSADEVEAFEQRGLAAAGIDFPLAPSRYRSTYFRHVFEGGYAAAYYSYIWSEVLDADTAAWFLSRGGLTRENGERYRRTLLAPGGSVDAMDTYRDFRGQDPELSHLLERRGLVVD